MKKTIGGVSLHKKWKNVNKQEVLDYFLQNSDYKILTDTSVSCITYIATLRPNVESPFFFIRTANFQQPVRCLLLKICIHNTEGNFVADFRNKDSNKDMETMSPEDIIREAKIQDDIFRKSYITNIAEPICPSIIYVQTDITQYENLQQKYYYWIYNHLIERNPDSHKDHYITHYLFNNYPLSIIFMEFAEGYSTLFDLWNTNNATGLQNYLFMAINELYHLYHTYGIVHGDIHFGNILVNTSYPYLSDSVLGKIMIIDFGKSFYETPNLKMNEYDTIIYHKNTGNIEILLSNIPNKNDLIKKIIADFNSLRKVNIQSFLNVFFEGSLEKWKEWSDNNIHYPFMNDYMTGGIYHKKTKSKKITYNTKMNKDTFDSRIHLDIGDFKLTVQDFERFSQEIKESLEKSQQQPQQYTKPPFSPEKAKKKLAEYLNSPLEIQNFQNPYMYPIGNPLKKIESDKKSKKNKTKKTKID
jgi:hypothetical protein